MQQLEVITDMKVGVPGCRLFAEMISPDPPKFEKNQFLSLFLESF